MTQYVCGFYFDHLLKSVVLIWKEKPDWQKGKLNGIGGKIEPGESPELAMEREFEEETGLNVQHWEPLIKITGSDWCCYFFCSFDEGADTFEYAETMEQEEVAKVEVDRLDDFDHIPNLRWLIPLALHKLSYRKERLSFF